MYSYVVSILFCFAFITNLYFRVTFWFNLSPPEGLPNPSVVHIVDTDLESVRTEDFERKFHDVFHKKKGSF